MAYCISFCSSTAILFSRFDDEEAVLVAACLVAVRWAIDCWETVLLCAVGLLVGLARGEVVGVNRGTKCEWCECLKCSV